MLKIPTPNMIRARISDLRSRVNCRTGFEVVFFLERLVDRLFPLVRELLRVVFLERVLVFRRDDAVLFLLATEITPRGAIIA